MTNVLAIAVGWNHTLALKADGTLVGWGGSDEGQLSIPPDLTGVIAIAAGRYHSLALKADGTVVGWGSNYYGQSTVPLDLASVSAISAGGFHSTALKSDGTVVAWGSNYSGETSVPTGLINAHAIGAARGSYTMAILADVPVPVDCVVSEFGAWSDWEPISGSEEQRTRTRTILTHPANGGAACPYLIETETRLVTVPVPTSCVFDFSPPVGVVIDWTGGTIRLTDAAGCVKIVTR